MKLLIEIPDEFENDFRQDAFKDCFERIKIDLEDNIKKYGYGVAGNYELETFGMLKDTFEKRAQIVEDEITKNKIESR